MKTTLLTLVQATLWFYGESPTYILHEDIHPVVRAIGVSHIHSLQNLSFDEIFDLTDKWSVLSFFII